MCLYFYSEMMSSRIPFDVDTLINYRLSSFVHVEIVGSFGERTLRVFPIDSQVQGVFYGLDQSDERKKKHSSF